MKDDGMPSKDTRFEGWELELLEQVLRQIRTWDREELRSELLFHLWRLKETYDDRIRHWKTFLRIGLYNRAISWARAQRHHVGHAALDTSVVDEEAGEPITLADVVSDGETEHDLRIAVAWAWDELEPEFRDVCDALIEKEGRIGCAAKRLRIHRNTIRTRTRKARQHFERHGF